MLKKILKEPKKPKRILLFGCNGFIGNTILTKLAKDKINFLGLSKEKYNLLDEKNISKIRRIIKPTDCIIFISAIAPCKNLDLFSQNLIILNNFCKIILNKNFIQLINISSDAVFSDTLNKINETANKEPSTIHGLMHLTREKVFENIVDPKKLVIVRPTLLYGKQDPHNSYGPNMFARLISNNKDIKLFGNGEERRDHVSVDDVAEIIKRILIYRCYGSINIVSGKVISFYDIANYLKKISNSKININTSKRIGPMPHNGYRAFDNSLIEKIFAYKMKNPKIGFKDLLL